MLKTEMMETRQRFQNVFRDVFDDASIKIRDEMTAQDIEGWDSLGHIQLVMAMEKEFVVKFTTAEIIDLKNVGEFLALLGDKLR